MKTISNNSDRTLVRELHKRNATLANRLDRIEAKIGDSQAIATDMMALKQAIGKLAEQSEALIEKFNGIEYALKPAPNRDDPPLELVDTAYRNGVLRETILSGAAAGTFSKHLIIPVHPPKVAHLSSIFSMLDNVPHDASNILLTLIATTPAESVLIQQYITLTKPAIPMEFEIVAATDICQALKWNDLETAIVENRAGGIINMKKLLALYRALSLGAQQVCCVDIDVMIRRKPEEIFQLAAENYEKKVFFAAFSSIDITKQVVTACTEYFLSQEKDKLHKIYEGGLFSWFFDIPTYMAQDASNFLSHIQSIHGGMEAALSRLSWHHFDYVLYINYLILKKDFNLVDIRSIVRPGAITDALNLMEVKTIAQLYDYTPVWATLSALAGVENPELDRDFAVICHIDRV